MTTRVWNSPTQTQTLTYDEENRLVTVTDTINAYFFYDGQGARIQGDVDGVSTQYVGNWFEWADGEPTSYYYLGGMRVAMSDTIRISYIHGNHLSSAKKTSGDVESGPQRYYPYGSRRGLGTVATEYGFTGQREGKNIGLYYYNARWYDPYVGRFIQPDTIVPEPGSPQAYNRYSYVYNNPVTYSDPTGQEPREKRPGDTAVSYILREMHTNASSVTTNMIRLSNRFAEYRFGRVPMVGVLKSGCDVVEAGAAAVQWYGPGTAARGFSYKLWYDKVHTGGDWDHKPVIKAQKEKLFHTVPGLGTFKHDMWSNIHYGYVGSSAGLSITELLAGAGLAQYRFSTGEGKAGYQEALESGEVGPHTYYDWPQDQRAIAFGNHLWEKYGEGLTEGEFVWELEKWNMRSCFGVEEDPDEEE